MTTKIMITAVIEIFVYPDAWRLGDLLSHRDLPWPRHALARSFYWEGLRSRAAAEPVMANLSTGAFTYASLHSQ